MRGTWVIYRRELASLFLTPLAWVLLCVAFFVNGYLFIVYVDRAGHAVGPAIDMALGYGFPFWMLLVLLPPLICMRMIAEEGRSGTLEFLLTAPVTDVAAVGGKFLAALTFMAILWASVPIYAAVVAGTGTNVDWGMVCGGYIGALLSSALLVSIGLFANSLTSTPVVGAFLGFIGSICWLLLPFVAPTLIDVLRTTLGQWTGDSNAVELWVRGALGSMAVVSHMQDSFLRGIFDTSELAFFLSWTALFFFFTVRMIEARRWRA